MDLKDVPVPQFTKAKNNSEKVARALDFSDYADVDISQKEVNFQPSAPISSAPSSLPIH